MAKIEHKDIGDRLQPQFSWTVGGVGTDPTQIIVRQQDSAGVETVVTTASSPAALTSASTPLARMSAGVFKLSPGVSAVSSGYWFFRAEGTGGAEAAEEYEYIVDPSEFTSNAGLSDRALVSLAETKDWLRQQSINTSGDLQLVRVINDVSDRIHYEAGREFKPITAGASTRTFLVAQYGNCLRVGDMNVLTTASPAISIIGSDWVTTIKTLSYTDVTTHPIIRAPWEPIRKIEINPTAYRYLVPGQRVTVNATWGFPSVPGNIRQAALDVIGSVMDTDVEHYREDITAETGGTGSGVAVLAPQQMFVGIPPEQYAVVRSYRDPVLG